MAKKGCIATIIIFILLVVFIIYGQLVNNPLISAWIAIIIIAFCAVGALIMGHWGDIDNEGVEVMSMPKETIPPKYNPLDKYTTIPYGQEAEEFRVILTEYSPMPSSAQIWQEWDANEECDRYQTSEGINE